MTTDKPKTTRERIERMRERVEQELLHVYGDRDDWAESLLTLIDTLDRRVLPYASGAPMNLDVEILSALESAVDDLCVEGRG